MFDIDLTKIEFDYLHMSIEEIEMFSAYHDFICDGDRKKVIAIVREG